MIENRNYGYNEPLTYMGRLPVYLATAIAMAHGVTMILFAFAGASGLGGWLMDMLIFTPAAVVQDFQIWRLVTYAFVNPPSFMTAVQIVLLAMFGQEVEKFLGRVSFAWLYGLLIVAAPLLAMFFGFFGGSASLAGSDTPNFAVFIAFVLIYPNATMFFGILAKWLGIALFGLYSLILLSNQAWVQLAIFWGECAVAALWLAREGVSSVAAFAIPSPMAWWRSRHSKRHLRVVPREPGSAKTVAVSKKAEPSSAYESIDPILDKIARQGIGSLTKAEREKLERARAELLAKERSE